MKIAVINEISAAERNTDIISALDGRGHLIINAGMKRSGEKPELTYIHTGFLAALLLNTGRADLVVGGCGTGAGFMNSSMQYPGVVCGLIARPLDALLFSRINGGNCISLQLLYEYGWAGDLNLKYIFDSFFSVEPGSGYPPHRRDSQKKSRELLWEISAAVHLPMPEIIRALSAEVTVPALSYPGIKELLDLNTLPDLQIKTAIKEILN